MSKKRDTELLRDGVLLHGSKPGGPCVHVNEEGKCRPAILVPAPEDSDPSERVHLEPIAPGVSELYRQKGPTKVTSDAYREGWDTIFGGKQQVAEA